MILALDYGEKRIGVAVTDETEKFVKELDYIPNNSELKRISLKDYPKGTDPQSIKQIKKESAINAKIEFRKLCNKLLYLINCYYPSKIIIGLPMTTDAKTNLPVIGKQAKKIKQFVRKLELCLKSNKISLEIILVEESLTSKIASQELKRMGLSSTKQKDKIDSFSAKILLEEYISNKSND